MNTPRFSQAELEFRKLMSRLYRGEELPDDWGENDPEDTRSLYIATLDGCYDALSGILIQVEGTPPKGTLVIIFDCFDIFDISSKILQMTFLAPGRTRTLRRGSKEYKIVKEFINELASKGLILTVTDHDPMAPKNPIIIYNAITRPPSWLREPTKSKFEDWNRIE